MGLEMPERRASGCSATWGKTTIQSQASKGTVISARACAGSFAGSFSSTEAESKEPPSPSHFCNIAEGPIQTFLDQPTLIDSTPHARHQVPNLVTKHGHPAVAWVDHAIQAVELVDLLFSWVPGRGSAQGPIRTPTAPALYGVGSQFSWVWSTHSQNGEVGEDTATGPQTVAIMPSLSWSGPRPAYPLASDIDGSLLRDGQ
ncbi:hypothetical protein GQ53DRAFT_170370 [Thozetella sp. PMI_491]|nr:hypothetical protein GQ53DRAFT_170370 [Thozetella sp. PMI_491]